MLHSALRECLIFKITFAVLVLLFASCKQVIYYDSISLKSMPIKTEYFVGEKLDLSGLKLEVENNNGTKYIVNEFLSEPEDGTILEKVEDGKKTIKIIYLDMEVSFDITVIDPFYQFTEQPKNSTFILYEENQSLTASFLADRIGSLVFEWYRKNPNETEFSKFYTTETVQTEPNKIYLTEVVLPKNNFIKSEYECKAIYSCSAGDIVILSDSVVVNQQITTYLPTVCIDTNDGSDLIKKDDKIKSTVTVIDASHKELLKDNKATFSGRGNTTWWREKKPYKIKLNKKSSIFGMPSHKQWMLIANYQDMSFMKNEMAFCLSEQLGMDWTVHGKYVNLIKNNQYMGLYWFGEQIKVDENRVNIDANEDYLIELDVYYDENWKFKSEIRSLPYQIKNDDSMTEERLENLVAKINAMEEVLYNTNFPYTDSKKTAYDQTYKDMIDIESMAQFYLVNCIMKNGEINWPKSSFFTYDNTNSILKAGPVWDFDWAAYTNSPGLINTSAIYYDALFKTKDFNDKLNILIQRVSTESVSKRIAELKDEIETGVLYDGIRWGTANRNPVGEGKSNWSEYVSYLEECINTRLSYIKDMNFQTEYLLEESE